MSTDADGRFWLPWEDSAWVSHRSTHPTQRLVAAAEGFFIAGVDAAPGRDALLSLQRHNAVDRLDYAWIDPRPDANNADACANCHGAIYDEWLAGGHGAGHANRRFMGLFDGSDWEGNESVGPALVRDAPEAAGVCASCHTPGATDFAVIGDLRKASGVDRQGVHCDFCHKTAAVDVSRVGLDHGRFAMKLQRPPPGVQQFFGKLDDDDRGHSVHAAVLGESRFCAPCHEGVVFGKHQYSDYSDWRASDYARRGVQCQDCHMKPTGQMTNLAPGNGGLDRDPLRLPSHRPTAGRLAALRGCLSLTLGGRHENGRINVVATVQTHGIGHRFPAGHSARQLLLVIDARDAAGRPLEPLAGPYLTEGRSTRPGRLFAKMFRGFDGTQPIADWTPGELAFDTRLAGDTSDRSTYAFRGGDDATVTARLIYRRFDPDVARQKRWPDNEVLVHETTWKTASDAVGPR